MSKTLLISVFLSALLFATDAPENTPEEAKTLQTVDPIVVTPIVVQPVVVTPAPAPVAQEKEENHVCPQDMQKPQKQMNNSDTENYKRIRINVVGQGVAPAMTSSPAQAYALAKRAAIADAYRLMAEKIKGVRIEGSDKIKNMMVMRSEVRTFVDAVIAEAEIIETVFKDGLCEVEMELSIDPKQWHSILASR